MSALAEKTVFVTGASRGIGLAIAKRCAADGANVAVAAKSAEPHPKLPGTIHTAAAEVEAAGGRALPLVVDVRDADALRRAVDRTADHFGGLDILVNNASAIWLKGTAETSISRFDLMHQINVRGTFAAVQACLPHLQHSANPHILTLSPPLDIRAEWFKDHAAYSLSKFGMSLLMLGMAEEFRGHGIAVNCLWPRTMIGTAAMAMIGDVDLGATRRPEIVADAAHAIFVRDARACTGNFFVDEDVLRDGGTLDFGAYANEPGKTLLTDIFLD